MADQESTEKTETWSRNHARRQLLTRMLREADRIMRHEFQ